MVLVIICRKCHKANDTYKEAEFDYWQWFDATENFDDPHGRFCDVCGKEFEDGEAVILVNE
nr:MAG TPA: putative integral membrane zinc-ribbon metal-binding protein [Caudoviricetes sp.]DAZ84133.1 MAG TPA: putative integral membrane zinc-ribbon metal-binding protein [Caudoviricetes sp.]